MIALQISAARMGSFFVWAAVVAKLLFLKLPSSSDKSSWTSGVDEGLAKLAAGSPPYASSLHAMMVPSHAIFDLGF